MWCSAELSPHNLTFSFQVWVSWKYKITLFSIFGHNRSPWVCTANFLMLQIHLFNSLLFPCCFSFPVNCLIVVCIVALLSEKMKRGQKCSPRDAGDGSKYRFYFYFIMFPSIAALCRKRDARQSKWRLMLHVVISETHTLFSLCEGFQNS